MTGEFHNARYNGAVKVIADQQEQIRKLEKQLKQLQSEFNVLKKTHLEVIDDCVNRKVVLNKLKKNFIVLKNQNQRLLNRLEELGEEIDYD